MIKSVLSEVAVVFCLRFVVVELGNAVSVVVKVIYLASPLGR